MEKQEYLKQLSKELHKPARKNFLRLPVQSQGIRDIFAMDLADLPSLKDENDGYRYILVCLDVASRYAFAIALKDKKSATVLNAFKEIVKESGMPKKIWTDQGSEFKKDLSVFASSHKIKMYNSFAPFKVSIAERFNRTLKERMFQKFTELDTETWIDLLPDLLEEYNNSVNSGIGAKPIDAWKEKLPKKNVTVKRVIPKLEFMPGDWVRISRLKGTFEKGYSEKWSRELYQVVRADITQPIAMYSLEDELGEPIKGRFYKEELQKSDLLGKSVEKILKSRVGKNGDEIFVKFIGYPDKFNRWISAKDTL